MNASIHPIHGTLTTTISKLAVKALLAFASDDTTREHMSGVHFEPEGYAVATDGHTMAVFRIAPFSGPAYLVPREAFDGLLTGKDDLTVCAGHIAGGGKFGKLGAEFSSPGQAFPPWRVVMPGIAAPDKSAAFNVIGFNAAYLARVDLLQRACGEGGSRWQFPNDRLDAVRFDVGGAGETGIGEAFGAIMPCRYW